MQRTRVASSNIASIGYDGSTLEVEFLNNTIYHYYNIPQALYNGLMNASSHGGFLDAYIKKGGFRYHRVQ